MPNLYVLDTRKTLWFLRLGISSIICVTEIDFYSSFWFLIYFYIFFLIRAGRVSMAGNSLRAEKSHLQVQKVTVAGPKSHTRAKMSHWSVIIRNNGPGLLHEMSQFHTNTLIKIFDPNNSECEQLGFVETLLRYVFYPMYTATDS